MIFTRIESLISLLTESRERIFDSEVCIELHSVTNDLAPDMITCDLRDIEPSVISLLRTLEPILHETNVLTPSARDFLKYGQFELASGIVNIVWSSLHSSMKSAQVAEYFNCCALFFEHSNHFRRLRSALLCCLSVSSHSASEIQISAFRRLCFVDLITNGQVYKLPRWLESESARIPQWSSENHAKRLQSRESYLNYPDDVKELIRDFQDIGSNFGRFQRVLGEKKKKLVESGDWGIAGRLVIAKRAQFLKSQSDIFSSLRIHDCLSKLELGSVEDLIEVGEFFNTLYASEGRSCIVGPDNYLRFLTATSTPSHTLVTESISQIHRVLVDEV